MKKPKTDSRQPEIFKTRIVPAKPGSGKLFEAEFITGEKTVECLGMTFLNDEERRTHFLGILAEAEGSGFR